MIESILTYNIVSWYGYFLKQKNKLSQIINQANEITGHKQQPPDLVGLFYEKKNK